jgi:hydrogenase expression/formation protein HypE
MTTAIAPTTQAQRRTKRTHEHIRLAHGSGGQLTLELIETVFQPHFSNATNQELCDAAILENPGGRLAFCTDSHTVKPIFFPGGDIGRLAVSGTVNDLAVMGARAAYLTAGFILEEGFATSDLERVVRSMRDAALEAGVRIVAGDTKVVERGHGDGLFINTTGVGFLSNHCDIGPHRIAPGDVLLVNGSLGDHGLTVLSKRDGLRLELGLTSDVAPLNGLIDAALNAVPQIHCMRDLTRGGLAAATNELVRDKPFGIRVFDANVPIREDVLEYAEMLGLDPLLVANEGKVLFCVPAFRAKALLEALRAHPLGRGASIIGDVIRKPAGKAIVETAYGSRRILEMPVEEQLPRIC